MERLTAGERLTLWPDELWPQDIGAVALLDGSSLVGPDGRFQTDRVRRAIGARLHRVPRFRQLLCTPARGLGGPLWVDTATFDLADHVRVAALPAPADEAALLRAVESVRRRRLDRTRPLWEMWFLTGVSGGRVGLFIRMHHSIADGIAGVATIGAFLDARDDISAEHPASWTPESPPSRSALLVDSVARRVAGLHHVPRAVTHPLDSARGLSTRVHEFRELLATPPIPSTSLDRAVGPRRTLAFLRADLAAVARVAHRHHATVNDVLLTVTASGLHDLFAGRGETVGTVPVYVPVTLRPREQREHARGNLFGQMVVPLPVGPGDPAFRLRHIAADTAGRKARRPPNLGTMLSSPLARRALLRFLTEHPVSVTTADVPGPPQPVHLAGARLLEVFPVLPLIAHVPVAVGALSYAGQLAITVVADPDAVPDLGTFVGGAREALHVLTGDGPPGSRSPRE